MSASAPPEPTPRAGRLLDRFVISHLRWIDEHNEVPAGRVSPTARVTIVYLVAAMVLTIMAYGVLEPRMQRGAVDAVIAGSEALWPGAVTALRPYQSLGQNIAWALGCLTCYFVIPALIVRRVFGHRLRDYGLSAKSYLRHLPIYALLFIPVAVLVLLVAQNPDFQRQYPFYKRPYGIEDFLVWECMYAVQFFALEFFFRGFLLHGAKDRLGRFAVLVMVVPYTMIHFRKPIYETFGAIIAGSVLGTLSLRTRSIWGGWTIHVAVAVTMDIAALTMREHPFQLP